MVSFETGPRPASLTNVKGGRTTPTKGRSLRGPSSWPKSKDGWSRNEGPSPRGHSRSISAPCSRASRGSGGDRPGYRVDSSARCPWCRTEMAEFFAWRSSRAVGTPHSIVPWSKRSSRRRRCRLPGNGPYSIGRSSFCSILGPEGDPQSGWTVVGLGMHELDFRRQ